MSEELYEQIKEILINAKGSPLLKKEIFERLQSTYGYDGSERKVERALTYLETKEKIVKQVPYKTKRKGKSFTTLGWVICESGGGTKIAERLGADHTKDIQEKVIKPWLENLPVVCWDGVYMVTGNLLELLPSAREEDNKILRNTSEHYTFLNYYYPKNRDKKRYEDIFFEKVNKNLYEDLKENHIDEKIGNPFQLWNKFNSLSCKYWDRLCQFIEDVVDKFLTSKVGVSRENMPKDCYDFLVLDVMSTLWKQVPFVKNTSGQKYNCSHKKLKCGISYSESRYHFMATMRYREYFKEFHSKIEKNSTVIFEENKAQIEQIIKSMEQIEEIRKQLVDLLNAYSDVKILPGECHYLGSL